MGSADVNSTCMFLYFALGSSVVKPTCLAWLASGHLVWRTFSRSSKSRIFSYAQVFWSTDTVKTLLATAYRISKYFTGHSCALRINAALLSIDIFILTLLTLFSNSLTLNLLQLSNPPRSLWSRNSGLVHLPLSSLDHGDHAFSCLNYMIWNLLPKPREDVKGHIGSNFVINQF